MMAKCWLFKYHHPPRPYRSLFFHFHGFVGARRVMIFEESAFCHHLRGGRGKMVLVRQDDDDKQILIIHRPSPASPLQNHENEKTMNGRGEAGDGR